MTSQDLVREYLQLITLDGTDFDRLRAILADDFVLEDTLMGTSSADEFVAKLRAFQGPPLKSKPEEIVGDRDRVVALTVLDMMGSEIIYSQWFWLSGGKIQRIRTIYDPRPFLEAAKQ
ncbi:MAG: nuclear transport factor 2 family protein [bacterium]|nr:nuclear transport factor 2 family protein [bacterium]